MERRRSGYAQSSVRRKSSSHGRCEMEMEDFSMLLSSFSTKLNIFEAAKIPDIQYLEFPPDALEFKSDVSRDIIGLHFIEQGYGWQASFPGQTDPGPAPVPKTSIQVPILPSMVVEKL
jgi:hypothetical protein